jgi:hypothetical protein
VLVPSALRSTTAYEVEFPLGAGQSALATIPGIDLRRCAGDFARIAETTERDAWHDGIPEGDNLLLRASWCDVEFIPRVMSGPKSLACVAVAQAIGIG